MLPTAAARIRISSVDGRALNHVQLPTTLPTLDELIGVDDLTTETVADIS